MQTLSNDIIPALMLVIPFQGIFLSVFFFIKSQGNFTPNFFMGFLLLVLSLLSLKQLINLQNSILILVRIADFNTLSDLLLSPFLFLYIASYIRPVIIYKIHIHLPVVLINPAILLLSGLTHGLLHDSIVTMVIVISCQYLLKTLCLFTGLMEGPATDWKDVLIHDHTPIAVVSFLVFVNIVLAMLCPVISNGIFSYVLQLPKGILVFYVYYLILQTSDFNMGGM
jgi:hypothetical protein